jgi:hypothetical protein
MPQVAIAGCRAREVRKVPRLDQRRRGPRRRLAPGEVTNPFEALQLLYWPRPAHVPDDERYRARVESARRLVAARQQGGGA